MEINKLSEVSTIIMGQSPPSDSYNDSGDGLAFFQGKSDFGEVYPIERVYCTKPKKIAQEKDILISVRAPVGDVNIANQESCIGRGLAAIRTNQGIIDYKYLYYYLCFKKNVIQDMGTGSTFKAISKKDLEDIDVILFNLETQKKIVETLEVSREIIKKRRAQITALASLTQSVFLESFGDPIINKKNWKVKKLGELCDVVRGGSPRPIDKYLGGTVPWIKIGDATLGDSIYLNSTKEKIKEEGIKKSRLVQPGSLIFANCGVSLGFARIITFEGCIHDGWLAFNNIKIEINKIFLLKLLNFYTGYFRKTAPDGTQPNLNTSIMKEFGVIIPPIESQKKFAEKVLKLEEKKLLLEKSLIQLENNFNSLMNRAFNGELFNN
jgi:type I restriction enzyme, S subunit